MASNETTPQFAVFDGEKEITEEMYREILDFAALVESQEKKK